ncbi:MAG: FtsQ-type POTRA domain-containing protein [Candidatus Eremiobacteraeota bacterium]|nr:FtsQ-type POTRA domain-containing protein [Candidatus Eremiobacteraeota bacterium]
MKGERTGRRRGRSSRLRPFALVAFVAALLLGAGFAWAASWPGFRPGRITVVGNERVSKARILEAASIDPRINIWLQSSAGISARLLRMRAIAHVAVHRYLPNRLSIVIRERTPVARLVAGDGPCVVDRRGFLFPALRKDRALPAVLTKRRTCAERRIPARSMTMRLLSVLRLADAADVRIAALSHDRYGEDRGVLADGTLVYIGDGTHLDRKFAELRALEKRLRASWGRVRAIDLRAPSTPVVVDGRKSVAGALVPINATKGRDRRVPHHSPVKTSSSRLRGASKNQSSGARQRASSPNRSASSP